MACSDVTVPANAPCDFSCLPSGDQWAVLLRLYLLRYGTELAPSVLVANSTCIANCIPQGAQLAVLLYLEQQISESTATPQELIDEAVCQNFAQSAGMALPTLIAFMQGQLENTETASQLANDSRCLFSCIPEGMFLPALIYVAQLTAGNTQTASDLASEASVLVNIFPGSYYISTIRRIIVVSAPCTADLLLTQSLAPVQTTYVQGDTLTFTITVLNNGPDTATSLNVVVELPAMVVGSLTVSEAYTSSGSPPNQVLAVPLADLANGASKVFTVAFTLLSSITAGTFSQTATVLGDCTDVPANSTKTNSFDTAVPATDMVIWVDGSQLTDPNGTILSPWADLSGNGNHINQQFGNMVVNTNIQNGYRGVRFGNGVAGRSIGPSFGIGGPWSVVCVFKLDAAPATGPQRALQMFSSNLGLGSDGTANNLRAFFVNGALTIWNLVASVTPPRCHVMTTATTPASRWVVGAISNVTSVTSAPAGRFSLGADTIAEPMQGYWFEFRCFNRVLSATEISTMIAYMKNKWALP